MKVDWLIVGSGYSGCVLAERIASQLDKKVLIVELKNHLGGHSHDGYDDDGVLIHTYGSHIFHTRHLHVYEYLSRFTGWRPYFHRVEGFVDGKPTPIPFNLNSIYQAFAPDYAAQLERTLLDEYGWGKKVPILEMRESASGPLRQLADYIYDNVFHGYTVKQWERTPQQLDPSVTARVPVFVSRDDRYFQDPYQGIPLQGYTRMFERMIDHPNIMLLLGADYRSILDQVQFDRMIYTGPIDAFFDHTHGRLPYRSLRFERRHHAGGLRQRVAVYNYPNENLYTRVHEFRHLTGQQCEGTSLAYEYSEAYEEGKNDPYYPIPMAEYREILKKYKDEASKAVKTVTFCGRLADYTYYNMDQTVARALKVFETRIVP